MSNTYYTDLLQDDALVPQRYRQDDDAMVFTIDDDSQLPSEPNAMLEQDNQTLDNSQSLNELTPTLFNKRPWSTFQVEDDEDNPEPSFSTPSEPLQPENSQQTLLFQDSQETIALPRDAVMTLVETTMLEVFQSLSILKPIELQFMSRYLSHQRPDPEQTNPHQVNRPRFRPLSMKSGRDAITLTRYVRVLEVIYEALATNIIMTQRDIFYRDVPLFKTQPVVNKIVDDICCHYNVPRSSLNVSVSGKGRIFGPANIIMKNHRLLNCMATANGEEYNINDEQGVLIPPINQILDIDCHAQILLVIEKEASFRHLISAGFVQMLLRRCILITGCGYPDLATRHMVKHISTRYPQMRIVAVMDNDLYGLDIYSVYKWGSLAQAHDSINLTIPTIQFLGITCDDMKEYQIPHVSYMPLSQKDREKGFHMLKTIQHLQHGSSASLEQKKFMQVCVEICKILHRNYKCELQALCADGLLGFVDYLQMKLQKYMMNVYS